MLEMGSKEREKLASDREKRGKRDWCAKRGET
jgi:hypothetical protein